MSPKSYSRWATYSKCPAKYNFLYNDKFKAEKKPPAPAMLRGTEIHNSIENYFLKKSEFLHKDIHENYGQFFMGIREAYKTSPEHEFAVTANWKETTFKADNCAVRGYLDSVIYTPPEQNLVIHEYKSGKVYPEHVEQRSLYGTIGLVLYEEYDVVEVQTIYVDLVDTQITLYRRDMLPEYKDIWRRRFNSLDEDEVYITKPQFGCRWCECSKANGGPCPF